MNIDEDVQSAIDNLKALPKRSPTRLAALLRLALALQLRGAERQNLQDLDEGANYYREALKLHPKGEVDTRQQSHQNLAGTLMTRYGLTNDPRDLDACINHFREASQLLRPPLEGPSSFSLFTGYGIALRKRHELTGKFPDINEAVKLHRDALALLPSDHGSRHWAHFCLAMALSARGLQHDVRDDVNLAVNHYKAAFNLWPVEDEDRYSPLYNVAYAFMACFDMSKDPGDLNEGVRHYALALDCITVEHPCYPTLRQHRDLALQKHRALLGQLRPDTSLSSDTLISSSQNLLGARSVVTSSSSNSQKLRKTNIFEIAQDVGSKYTMELISFTNLVRSSPASAGSYLKSLYWYKERDGVKHEFLVVQATPVDGGDPVWIRLDRAAKRAYAKTFRFWAQSDSSSSRFPADDCALICTDQVDALGDMPYDEVYRCRFQPPLRLEIFARLSKILSEVSPHYTLPKENCWFFCSTITEVLTREFSTEAGRGSVAHPNLGADVRKRIHERFKKDIMISRENC